MRISALLVTAAIIGGMAGSNARAQATSGTSTGSATNTKPQNTAGTSASAPATRAQTASRTFTSATTMKAQTRSGTTSSYGKAPEIPGLSQRKGSNQKSTRRTPPPPSPTHGATRGRSHQASARKPVRVDEMFGGDPTGRKDLSGRPVPFYPSSRSLTQAKSQQSATKPHAQKVRENPQPHQ